MQFDAYAGMFVGVLVLAVQEVVVEDLGIVGVVLDITGVIEKARLFFCCAKVTVVTTVVKLVVSVPTTVVNTCVIC